MNMEENARTPRKPAVLFVCAKNGGKSQMAAGLMKLEAGSNVAVSSAGTKPGSAINGLAAEVLLDLGVDISAERPKALTEEHMREAGLVVVLGAEAKVPALEGVRVETWETDEPSARGIEGRERMELVRDDIHARVKELAARLLGSTGREENRGA
jgi:arsenate-mycothiol transferase